ncbi:MAG TPA: hypothetical protein PKZ75_12085 [Bacteroidia bacterium]|nr:hypothetical protein [Bacteroidia bacterium]
MIQVLIKFSIPCLISVILLSNCQKKETTGPETEAQTNQPNNACFNAMYNGTYVGSGFLPSSPYTSGTLTITKTDCQTISLNLYTNTGGGTSTNATQLAIQSNGSYSGKITNGNNITLTGGGNHMYVVAANTFTFNGDK